MMKYLFNFLIVLLFLLIALSFSIINPVLKKRSVDISIPVSIERLQADVETLTENEPARNYLNTTSLNKVADYIFNEFAKLDLKPERQWFTDEGRDYQNVIARYGPNGSPKIVVGAHYDVCEDQPGADDNASGVAGVLELARLFQQLQPELSYQIEFVAYTLEEPPYFRTTKMGSAVHAKSLKDANAKVALMVCLEMIGYFSDEKNSQNYPIGFLKAFYPTTGNFIAVIGKLNQIGIVRKFKRKMKAACGIPVKSINAPVWVQGIDFSDHRNYWEQGYKALMIGDTAFYRNENYHQKTDTIDTLNFEKMAEVIKGVYYAIVSW